MGRWVAIGVADGWHDFEQFKAQLGRPERWRIDAQTSITSVIALHDGRLLAECDSPKRERFEAWLAANGWTVESITPIVHLARAGAVYKIE